MVLLGCLFGQLTISLGSEIATPGTEQINKLPERDEPLECQEEMEMKAVRSSPTKGFRSSPMKGMKSSPTKGVKSSPTKGVRSSPTRAIISVPTPMGRAKGGARRDKEGCRLESHQTMAVGHKHVGSLQDVSALIDDR